MNQSIKVSFQRVVVIFFFSAWYLVCTTVAHKTLRWLAKFVDKVGSTVLYRNSVKFGVFAIRVVCFFVTKADPSWKFTIFQSRMSTIQPARVGCSTFKCWYACCWHFCSCSSHKSIPSLGELFVTQLWAISRCRVTALSIGLAQFFIIITRIG